MRTAASVFIAVVLGAWLTLVEPAHAGLVSHWAAEGNTQDSTGSNHGTLVSGVTFGPGQVGQAFRFDGTGLVEAGSLGMPTGIQDRTIFLWFNVTSSIAEEAFFAGYGGFGEIGRAYELLAVGNTLYFSQWGSAISGGTFEFGQWHSAAVTNVGSLVTLYLDGNPVAANTFSLDTQSGTSFYIGRLPGVLGESRRLNGLVDEVRVFDTALSDAEIRALSVVPEPTTLFLFLAGAGLTGIASICRRQRLNATP
jgi:hypothetical protein